LGPPRKNDENETVNVHIKELYRIFPSGGGTLDHCAQFCKRIGLPITWRSLLAYSAHRDQNLGIFNDSGVLVGTVPTKPIEILWRALHHYTNEEALFIR